MSLSAIYGNYVRYFTPHVLGRDRRARLVVLAYQFGGGFEDGLPAQGTWCCFDAAHLSQVRYLQDRWVEGPLETQPKDLFATVVLSTRSFAPHSRLAVG
jgi:hypothetical protein